MSRTEYNAARGVFEQVIMLRIGGAYISIELFLVDYKNTLWIFIDFPHGFLCRIWIIIR